MTRMPFAAVIGLMVSGACVADEARSGRDSQCPTVMTKAARAALLQGRDPRAMEREGYPSDPNVQYQKAKEIGNMRDAWGAIIMVQEGVGTKRDLRRADALWTDYWCSQVLPAFEDKRTAAFETLKAAAGRGLPTAMLRLSEVYAKGEFGQPTDQRLSAEWKTKYEAIQAKRN